MIGLLAFASCSTPRTASVSAESLERHVRYLSEIQPSRDWQHPDPLDAIADYIGSEFQESGGRVEFQLFEVEGGRYQKARVRGMINLEMVGYFTDEPDSESYPLEAINSAYPSVGNFTAVVGRPEDAKWVASVREPLMAHGEIPVIGFLAPASLQGVDFSDRLNYWAAGIPALMITDTSFFRNPNYHEATDTADTLDYFAMKALVRGVHAAILGLAKYNGQVASRLPGGREVLKLNAFGGETETLNRAALPHLSPILRRSC